MTELKDMLGADEILEAVFAQILHLRVGRQLLMHQRGCHP